MKWSFSVQFLKMAFLYRNKIIIEFIILKYSIQHTRHSNLSTDRSQIQILAQILRPDIMQLNRIATPNHRMIGLDLADVDDLIGVHVQLAHQIITVVGFQIIDQPAQ